MDKRKKDRQLGDIRTMENNFFPAMSSKMDENVGKKSHWRDYAEPEAFIECLQEQIVDIVNFLNDEVTPVCHKCGRRESPSMSKEEVQKRLQNSMVNIANYAMIVFDSSEEILDGLAPKSVIEVTWPGGEKK